MTPEQKYQKIKEACQKINPALLELTFGCEIKRKSFFVARKKDAEICIVYGVDKDGFIYYHHPTIPVSKIVPLAKEEVEILGHEPSLADCLNAVNTKLNKDGSSIVIVIGDGGDFGIIYTDRPNYEKYVNWNTEHASWNLLKPSLRDNPQCWDFLYQLLCGK